MEKVYIITTPLDYSILTLKKHLDAEVVNYSELTLDGQSLYRNGALFSPKNVLLRSPIVNGYVKPDEPLFWHFVNNSKYNVLTERHFLLHNSFHYQDKAWQAYMFQNHNIPHSKTVFKPRDITKLRFPVVIKRRIGYRGKANYVLNNLDELFRFSTDFTLDSIFQEYVKFQHDYRIAVIDKSIIWAAERELFLRGDLRRTAAYVVKKVPVRSLSPQIVNVINQIIHIWQADFMGIDIITTNNSPLVLEVNMFPQFVSKEVPDNNDIAGKLAALIKTRLV